MGLARGWLIDQAGNVGAMRSPTNRIALQQSSLMLEGKDYEQKCSGF
jgi:hypothetical protein